MSDLFRLKIVAKRQITVPQRLMDLLGLKQGDELQLKVAKGKIVRAYPVRITPDLEMSGDAQQRFEEIERETAGGADLNLSGLLGTDTDLSGLMNHYGGIRRVAPRNYRPSDARIEELVAECLANARLDVSQVDISVKQGEVRLEGTMKDKRERLMAELVTGHVLGVTDVRNEIQIAWQSPQGGVPEGNESMLGVK